MDWNYFLYGNKNKHSGTIFVLIYGLLCPPTLNFMPEIVNFDQNWTFVQPKLLICSKLTKGNKNKHYSILFILYIWQLCPATLNFMPEMVNFDPNWTFTQPNLFINSKLTKGNTNKQTGILLVQYIWHLCPQTLHFYLEMATIPTITWYIYFDLAIYFLKSNKIRYHRNVECTTASKSKDQCTQVLKHNNHHFLLICRQ